MSSFFYAFNPSAKPVGGDPRFSIFRAVYFDFVLRCLCVVVDFVGLSSDGRRNKVLGALTDVELKLATLKDKCVSAFPKDQAVQ